MVLIKLIKMYRHVLVISQYLSKTYAKVGRSTGKHLPEVFLPHSGLK
jgi:hypothetical protein